MNMKTELINYSAGHVFAIVVDQLFDFFAFLVYFDEFSGAGLV